MNILIETHGCKLNMADSQAMVRRFLDAGFDVASPGEAPDVYVLNSCTVTHVADRKARQSLSKARRTFPSALIVAAGCYPARVAEEVERLEGVDLVVPNRDKPSVVGLVVERIRDAPVSPHVPAPVSIAHGLLGRSRASVKIQEGCDQVCAYCIVPKVRGRERSIPSDLIVEQINMLVDDGCLEVVLTGTQLGTYGFDLEGVGLSELIRQILKRTPAARMRLSSLQPLEITNDLLSIWKGEGAGRLCPHLHIPLQSGSDRILQAMRRRYDRAQFLGAVERVRQAVPGCSITTDIISGFPGETDTDHAGTLAMVNEVGFADCHVFPYSARPGTTAAYLEDHVAPEVRTQRATEIREAAAKHVLAHRRQFLGTTRSVLWEGAGRTSGLTDNYLRVVRQGRGVPAQDDIASVIENVELVELTDDALLGVPVA